MNIAMHCRHLRSHKGLSMQPKEDSETSKEPL